MYKTLKFIHLTAGLIGSLLELLMAITGILLNHRSPIGYSSDSAMKLQEFNLPSTPVMLEIRPLYGLRT